MAPSLKMPPLASAVVAAFLLFATPQTRGWTTEDDQATSGMVPVSPAERVLVAMPGGGVGTQAAPVCMQCRCCTRSSPARCEITSCCSTFNCNAAGKCNLVQQKCGCSGCGGTNEIVGQP